MCIVKCLPFHLVSSTQVDCEKSSESIALYIEMETDCYD